MLVALCPSTSSRYGDTLMFTCATSCFHGKEWFGSVSLKMESKGEKEKTSCRQPQLLFKSNMTKEQ